MQAISGRRRYVQFVAASCLAASLLAASIGPGARAAVPGSMDYQGYLTDPSGAAIDTDASITFSIYTVEIGGTALWTETMLVPVDSGLFSVTLGNPVNPFPPGLFDTPLFLGIDIGGDGEMVPRRALTTSAFSFRADDATTLQGNTAADLDQSAAVAALEANTVLQLDTVLTLGPGGEARIEAPGGVKVDNSAGFLDLIVGGSGPTAQLGVIASTPAHESSDLFLHSNDFVRIGLDSDGSGEDADFIITDKDSQIIFNVDEDGQVQLHGATSLTAGDDPILGPVLSFIGETADQTEAGRIRFFESAVPGFNLRGGYLHYDASANKMHIGVHDTNDTSLANDKNIITIDRPSGQVGIGTESPTRELTVGDTDASGDAVINLTAPNRELIVGVNQSSGGIIGTLTDSPLAVRTNGANRLVISETGNVTVHEDLLVQGELQNVGLSALQASVLQLETVLSIGGGGEAEIVAPGGLGAANSATGPDLIVGGLDGTNSGDDGVIASAPQHAGSDLFLQSNDAVVVELDNDGNGEDADFVILDKDDNEIFNIEEDGQVRLHGPASMTAGDDPTFGPVLTFLGTAADQAESGRIRFREDTAATNLRGGYLHYDGAADKMHIGVHDTSDNDLANDEDIITIERASGQVGIGTASPTRELTVNDTDGSSDAVINVTAPNRELLLGVNQSSGGIIAMQTANDLQLRTSGTTRVVVDAAGDVEVREDLIVEGDIRKDYGGSGLGWGTPFAMGRVIANNGSPSFRSKTSNVTEVSFKDDGSVFNDDFYSIQLSDTCTSDSQVTGIVALLTVETPGVDDVAIRADCLLDVQKIRFIARTRNALGHATDIDFNFVAFRID